MWRRGGSIGFISTCSFRKCRLMLELPGFLKRILFLFWVGFFVVVAWVPNDESWPESKPPTPTQTPRGERRWKIFARVQGGRSWEILQLTLGGFNVFWGDFFEQLLEKMIKQIKWMSQPSSTSNLIYFIMYIYIYIYIYLSLYTYPPKKTAGMHLSKEAKIQLFYMSLAKQKS